MKQFKLHRANGTIRGPLSWVAARNLQRHLEDVDTLDSLAVGMTWTDSDGDTWIRFPDRLQDDVPMAATDVTACRDSATRVRQSLRLERIATAALQGIMAAPACAPMTPDAIADCAIRHAKALILELDAAK